MKPKITVTLESEAARFTDLAKVIALQLLHHPARADVDALKRKAQDHLLRAETYRDAARLADKN